jgi:hypothetical protein
MEASLLKAGFTYLLGKILVVRQCIKGVVTFFVAKGNHRVCAMKQHPDKFPDVLAIVIAAPDGMCQFFFFVCNFSPFALEYQITAIDIVCLVATFNQLQKSGYVATFVNKLQTFRSAYLTIPGLLVPGEKSIAEQKGEIGDDVIAQINEITVSLQVLFGTWLTNIRTSHG